MPQGPSLKERLSFADENGDGPNPPFCSLESVVGERLPEKVLWQTTFFLRLSGAPLDEVFLPRNYLQKVFPLERLPR